MRLIPKKAEPILTGKVICDPCWDDILEDFVVDCGYEEGRDCRVLEWLTTEELWIFVNGR